MVESDFEKWKEGLRQGYDLVAEQYAEKYFHELDGKPIDRALLDRLADGAKGLGPICDMGCGPGQIARYLNDRGASVLGVDLSPNMVKIARRLSPDIDFMQGNMLALDVEDDSWGGIAGFYSIIHIPTDRVPIALGEFHRVLVPNGLLLLAFHIGDEHMFVDELWGERVSLNTMFFPVAKMVAFLEGAGFELLETVERPPYGDFEYHSNRAYLFARKPITR
jgi:SAM-dependent methyltransferase